MFPLFETIRIIDGSPQNLYWHERRMEESSRALLGTPLNVRLDREVRVPDEFRNGVVRCRILYGASLGPIQFSPYCKRKISSLKLVEAHEAQYPFKTCNRTVLDRLLEQRGDCDDILIVRHGNVTDTSFANIIFFDGSHWFTPEEPLLRGTCRERLLIEKRIIPAVIKPEEISLFKGFKLINALRMPEEEEMIPVSRIF